MSNLMKIRPGRAEIFHADRQTDGKTEQIFAFCSFANTATLISGHICTCTIALFFFFDVKKITLEVWPSIFEMTKNFSYILYFFFFAQQPFRDVRVYLCSCLGSAVCWRRKLVFCMGLQEFPMSLLLTDNNTKCCNQKCV